MKYRCTHCNHTFGLSERDFQRCPNCFWTTSLVNLEQAQKEPSESKSKPVPVVNVPSPKKEIPSKPLLILFFLILVAGLIFFFIKNGYWKQLNLKMPAISFPHKKEEGKPLQSSKKESPPNKLNTDQVLKSLSETEWAQLTQLFQITIPRRLSEDEEAILKKQVSLPAKLTEKPVITLWKKEDFETLIRAEQKNRKIQLGWSYERSLIKVFDKNYPLALKAFDKGDYETARTYFLNSLAFPVYQNNQQLYRAVVLVMLRAFINDVIAKIALINQCLIGQTYLNEVHSIFQAYQALFPVFELQEWDRSLEMIHQLKDQIKTFEQKPKEQTISYPPSFGRLDPEIQNAIQVEAQPKTEAAVNLKTLLIDLDLKEKIVRSNTPGELANVQKQYQQALSLIKEGKWEEARNELRSIEFPPELVEDAKVKLETIEKILAVSNSNQTQQTNHKH